MPLVPRPGTAPPQSIDIGLAELVAPAADDLIAHGDPTLGKEFLDITVAEQEAVVQQHGVADEFTGKTMASVEG
ncbi:MAG TPA: hypothetical protein VGW38_24710 [Chloroflexota bacterium]|nr:hypothetical protein [Chloroflexota bacterium]